MQLCLTMSRAARLYLLDEPRRRGPPPPATTFYKAPSCTTTVRMPRLCCPRTSSATLKRCWTRSFFYRTAGPAPDRRRRAARETGGELDATSGRSLQMLTNLLHYEFKSTGRVKVGPICGGRANVLNILLIFWSSFLSRTPPDRLPLAGCHGPCWHWHLP